MHWKKRLLNDASLYLILDTQVSDYDQLFEILKYSVQAGVDIVQLRDKNESEEEMVRFAHCAVELLGEKVPFIMNDRVDLALSTGVAGVHIGQDDASFKETRKILGNEALIGVSCQNLEHALKAQEEGADYIGFGSVFKTKTKPDREEMDLKILSEVVKRVEIPVFAIGGITQANVQKILDLGVRRVAVCRAVCEAENFFETVKDFKELLVNNARVIQG